MIRLNMIVEGQTEETFVGQILTPYFAELGIYISVRCVETSRKRGKIFRGGMTEYIKAKNDLIRWIKEDGDAWYTTMFDLYALPNDFPGFGTIFENPYKKVEHIENEFKNDINNNLDARKFIPYIQLHEFEALLLTDPQKFSNYFIDRVKSEVIDNLKELCNNYESPEHINSGVETVPSKRIISFIPDYKGLKTTAGPFIANEIGLNAIRSKCKHFATWLEKLENLVENV